MKVISLGGVGGCELAQSLRSIGYETYPYDWLNATQSFVLRSFNDINKFFVFDERNVYKGTYLLDRDKGGIISHDFENFAIQKNEVIQKYTRRFNRLNEALESDEEILFIRLYDNLDEPQLPLRFYDSIFSRDQESIELWNSFITGLGEKYKKRIRLLVLTNREISSHYENVLVHRTSGYKHSETISKIVKTFLLL
jgi:hypothetical protein